MGGAGDVSVAYRLGMGPKDTETGFAIPASFPTTNLVSRYEPWRWGYTNNDTINTTTKKFQDDSGNARHLSDEVTGSPTYLTNILNGMACVRFSGSSQRVSGNFTTGALVGTVAALVIPRGTGTRSIFSYNDNSGVNSGEIDIFNDGAGHYTGRFANTNPTGFNTTSNTATPVVGQADVVYLDWAGSGTNHLRINAADKGNCGAQNIYASLTRFTCGDNGLGTTYWNGDVLALFIYSDRKYGSQDMTDLETYLTKLQTSGP
jgi:hypothetical protein